MYSIHNRDDLENLKKLQKTKSSLHKEIKRETWEARLSLRYGRSF